MLKFHFFHAVASGRVPIEHYAYSHCKCGKLSLLTNLPQGYDLYQFGFEAVIKTAP